MIMVCITLTVNSQTQSYLSPDVVDFLSTETEESNPSPLVVYNEFVSFMHNEFSDPITVEVNGELKQYHRPAIPTENRDTLFIERSSLGEGIFSLWIRDPKFLKDPIATRDTWPHFQIVDNIYPYILRIQNVDLSAKK